MKATGAKTTSLRTGTWQLHLLILLPLLLVLLFAYVPMGGVLIAFEDFIPKRGIFGSPWVGLDNFRFILNMPDFQTAFLNTLKIAILKIVIGFPIPIVVALLLNEVRRLAFKKAVQTIVYLPYFLSWAVLGGIILEIFSREGAINRILAVVGIDSINWLGEGIPFITLLVGSDIWKGFGFGTIVYMAALTAIDTSLYEAAEIDGANRWRQTIHITIPGLAPVAVLLGILSLGGVLNAGFEQIFTLYSYPVYEAADIIDTLVYRLGIANPQYGFAAAVGLFKSVVSLVLIATGNWLAYRYSDYRVF